MRVAIDTTYTALGHSGTAVYIERLIPALEAEGVEVVRLQQALRNKRGGANKLRSAVNVALDLAWTRELLPRAAERAGAEVIHHPLPATSPGGLPQVVTIHDVAYARRPEDFDSAWRRYALRAHRKAVATAGAVVAVSESASRDAVNYLRAASERIVVAPHGPGQDLPIPAERSPEHWLYVGDAEPRKNVDGLIAAHARYAGSAPMVLAGAAAARADGAPRADGAAHADAAARADGAPPARTVTGIRDPDAAVLADLHARAIALVHPSREEGFGLTVLEAMSVGTPVIAVRNSAIEELARDAALVVDEWELAEAMQRVERDPALQRTMSVAGRRRAADFSWQRSAKAHIEAYTLALDSR